MLDDIEDLDVDKHWEATLKKEVDTQHLFPSEALAELLLQFDQEALIGFRAACEVLSTSVAAGRAITRETIKEMVDLNTLMGGK